MTALVAVLDDEPRLGQVLAMVLGREGYEVEIFDDPTKFAACLGTKRYDAVISDLKMPGMGGLEVLDAVREVDDVTPVILITAHGTVETALEAMKRGAYDYIRKPFDNEEIRAVVRRALDVTRLARENRALRQRLAHEHGLDRVVAESTQMRDVLDLVRRAAPSSATVLIEGASGTGKEVVARALHLWSERVAGPFVAVNCKAFSPGVLESELFGHERGAFTGADRSKAGVFERGEGGTVFLDEIGEVDLDFQGKLLRVLQEREVQRVGGSAPVPVDVRVVAATNKDLRSEVDAGRFREDLFFRLAVIPVRLPTLAERREDILPLALLFLQRASERVGRSLRGWTPEAEAFLMTHDWPGNVRELENMVERAVILSRDELIGVQDMLVPSRPAPQAEETLHEFLDRQTAERIEAVLLEVGGRRAEAAARLGIDRTTLYRLLKRLGLEQ